MEEKHYNYLVQQIVLLVILVVLLALMFGGHWGHFEKLPDISPGRDIVYEGINPPKEMLNNPSKYIVGIIEENGRKVYFIKEKPGK